MTGWALTEAIVGFVLVVLACVVVTRPAYRYHRFLLGLAVGACAVGIFGVINGLRR